MAVQHNVNLINSYSSSSEDLSHALLEYYSSMVLSAC
jgi:hypothetical protein